MSKPLIVEVFREGKTKRIAVEEVECGHFLDCRVAEAAREALKAAREAGLFVSIVTAWRNHGQFQDGRRIELYISDHDEFTAIAQGHGLHLEDEARPGVFIVADSDKTPAEVTRP